jgi:hypothetical protein
MRLTTDIVRQFVKDFSLVYGNREDPTAHLSGRVLVISSIAACLSMCEIEDRKRIAEAVLVFTAKMGNEKFEDGPDFVNFLNENL